MQLKEVQHIGYAFIHRFKRPDGSIFELETSEEDYLQLGSVSPVNPTNGEGTWVCSYKTPRFDTANGKINEGEFSVLVGEGDNIWAQPYGSKLDNFKAADFTDIAKGDLNDQKIIQINGI